MTPIQLITWRAHNNISQQALATRLKLSVRTIARYEKGISPIPHTLATELAGMNNVEMVEEDPEITPATHPHLYDRFRKGYLRNREHPGYGKPLSHKVRVSELASYIPPDPFAERPSLGDRIQAMIDVEEKKEGRG